MPPPFLKIPFHISSNLEAHQQWCQMLKKAHIVVSDDMALQARAARGICLKPRNNPPETLGRMYAEYCDLINNMYDAYLHSVHLQRAPYMLELISVFLKRVYELRRELELIIVNDYIYIDGALQQLHKTPFDIQIVVPYHLPLESRTESIEQLLQEMWAEAYLRKFPPTPEPSESELSGLEDLDFGFTPKPVKVQPAKSDVSKMRSMYMMIKQGFLNATLIQKHERFRQWRIEHHQKEYNTRKTFYAVELKPIEIRMRAAEFIKKMHREFMRIKREKHRHALIDVKLGIIPDPFRHKMCYEEERNKLYDRYRRDRDRIRDAYMKEREKENSRLIMLKTNNQIDDVTDEIYAWFMEWYEGYEFFPQYPYDTEGGTLMVVRGDYPSIDEKKEMDEKLLKASKGKTKAQIQKEKMQEILDAERAVEALKDAARKEADALFKARKNPNTDPGYTVKQSNYKNEIADILAKYRASWSVYDKQYDEKEAHCIYGYIKSLLSEEIMCQIHEDCRQYVDELKRLDLKLLIKAQKKMFKREGKKWPKVKPRPKPPVPPPVNEFNIDEELLTSIQDVFDMELLSKPTGRLKDIWGDMNYAAYNYSILDPNAEFKTPGYGDVKRRMLLSCDFGTGIAPGAKRNKTVLLFGPERNGKSFLVDCVAGEINAVKIDISPEKVSAVCRRPAKVMSKVVIAARVFQPTVIFLKNIERVFAKKVLPEDRYLKAKRMKSLVKKMAKSIPEDDKIIFIATCSFPSAAKRGMMRLFSESILVPITDYGTLQLFFYNKLQAIRSMPRDYCVQNIAKLLAGYGFGIIFELFDKIMTPQRIVELNFRPLKGEEFLQPLLDADMEPVTQEDYKEYVDFFLKYSFLKKPRIEYEIINASRADVYEKLAKAKKKKGNIEE